jgi:hypothetical protein
MGNSLFFGDYAAGAVFGEGGDGVSKAVVASGCVEVSKFGA